MLIYSLLLSYVPLSFFTVTISFCFYFLFFSPLLCLWNYKFIFIFWCIILSLSLSCFRWNALNAKSCVSLIFLLSPIFLLYSFSPLLSLLSLCWYAIWPCGYSAQPNSLSYNTSHAIPHYCGSAPSSIFSPWICREDCHLSEVGWSASSSFISHPSIFLILVLHLAY